MTADNFDQMLNGLRSLKPYRVFTVELHGGQRFEVDHPDALVIRDGVAVFMAPGGVPYWFDHEGVNQIIGAPANTPDRRIMFTGLVKALGTMTRQAPDGAGGVWIQK